MPSRASLSCVLAMFGTAAIAAACPRLVTPLGAWLTGAGPAVAELARALAMRFMYVSIGCALLGAFSVLGSADRLPVRYGVACLIAYAMSVLFWAWALSFAQSAM